MSRIRGVYGAYLTTLQETLRDALVAVKKSVGKGVVKVDSAESEAVRVADGQVVK